MEEKLKCEVCGALVTRKSASQKYCASCRAEANSFKAKLHREERKAIKSYSSCCQNVDTLEEKCKEISRYNKLHNTHYSYGEYTALVRAGKIISKLWDSEKAGKKKKAGKK